MKAQGARKDLITLRDWTRSRAGRASCFWLKQFLEQDLRAHAENGLLQSSCARCHQMPLCPSPQCQLTAPVSSSHASPFHYCFFSPLLVARRKVPHLSPISVLLPASPPTMAASAFRITLITQDENKTENSRLSQVITVNVPGSLPLELA